ncbi:NAD(P)-binding domain-containing protein [Alphaproteobacteria bacterium]|nr:NAD(P)-binding domain-containing protein [Alphaproteobacteria bacterium]
MKNILKMNIGIAGCGTMGLPMLEVLLKKKVKAIGYDVRPQENFLSLKENFVSSKKVFFENTDVIFSLVRDINQTLELCEGSDGLFNLNSSKTLIICSTLSPAFLNDFIKKAPENIEIIEAPMSGAPMRAKEASLTFMVGSTKNQFETISPILNILGKTIHHIGKFGSGMSVKVLNNFVASCSVVAVRHVLSEAKNLNISPDQLLEILNCSSGKTWFSENLHSIDWSKESYNKENTIGILEKDVNSYLDGLQDAGTKTNEAMQNFQKALLKGLQNIPDFPNNN